MLGHFLVLRSFLSSKQIVMSIEINMTILFQSKTKGTKKCFIFPENKARYLKERENRIILKQNCTENVLEEVLSKNMLHAGQVCALSLSHYNFSCQVSPNKTEEKLESKFSLVQAKVKQQF